MSFKKTALNELGFIFWIVLSRGSYYGPYRSPSIGHMSLGPTSNIDQSSNEPGSDFLVR